MRKQSPLPERYQLRWQRTFEAQLDLRPGMTILDVGSGRTPFLDPEQRPIDCHYVGLDISADELGRAPAGSYDETQVSDLQQLVPALRGRFDLIVSWQLLEHVKDVEQALDNVRTYLVPGGRFVAMLSGKYSAFAIINMIVPARVGVWGMKKLLHRAPDSVFPAYYDRCSMNALTKVLGPWRDSAVFPLYGGATYFAFSAAVQRLYLAYEDWAMRRGHHNLATHYVLSAVA